MREGLLWFDSDQRRTPQEKLDLAAARFAERLGRVADVCYVNPAELFSHPTIRVLPDRAVMKHHLWVGCDEGAVSLRQRRKSA